MGDKTFFSDKPIGKSGTSIASGIYTEEYLSGLQGYQQNEIYMRMERSDTQVRKILAAVYNPIKSATWSVEAASDEQKDIEVASLMEQIIFKDIRWKSKLHEILTFIARGHSVFEVVHENKDSKEFGQYTGLANLAFRHQNSLVKWNHNGETGALQTIEQKQSGDIEVNSVLLPVENLLIFFSEQEGDNNGFALLRNLYGAWKRKNLALELKYIGLERFAIPTPILKTPSKIKETDKEYQDAVNVLKNFTSGNDTYLIYPEGYELTLHNNVFDPEKTQSAIKAEDEAMAGAIIASFLEMGIGGNSGNFALGDNLEKFFSNAMGYFADNITEVINHQLIPNLVFLNYGDSIGVMPKLTHSGIRDKAGKGLMEIVTGYVSTGVITADEPLEDHVRRVHKLPKKAEGEMLENQQAESQLPQSGDSNPSDDSSDEGDNGSPDDIQNNNPVEFAERTPKNLRQLMVSEESKALEIMQRFLRQSGDKIVSDILRKYKQLPDKSKANAIKDLKVGYKAQFKKELRAYFINLATMSLDMARASIPEAKNVKLSDKVDWSCKHFDKSFKFNDFSKLPRQIQILLSTQTDLIVNKQANDLEDRVAFQFSSSVSSTNDPDIIAQDLEDKVDEFIEAGVIKTAAANSTALLANETQNAFYFDEEVIDLVESFTFTNPDPKSAICQSLTGQTFASNDAEARRFTTPLHHNCKSYWSANLRGARNNPEVTGIPPISQRARDSITLSDSLEGMFMEGVGACSS